MQMGKKPLIKDGMIVKSDSGTVVFVTRDEDAYGTFAGKVIESPLYEVGRFSFDWDAYCFTEIDTEVFWDI